jgi:uncharacterized lipoprotein YajG
MKTKMILGSLFGAVALAILPGCETERRTVTTTTTEQTTVPAPAPVTTETRTVRTY